MWAMIVKEFRQVRRDRRTLAMMIVFPVLLLVVFGYAASFDVKTITVAVAGPQAAMAKTLLKAPFEVTASEPGRGRAWATDELRDGRTEMAVVTGGARPLVLIDGSQLFSARAALASLAGLQSGASLGGTAPSGTAPSGTAPSGTAPSGGGQVPRITPQVTILYNPQLKTSAIMIPGLCGVVLVFIGTIITSLGVVRERVSGTLEQLAVMPLRPRDVFLGKIAPYFLVAAIDLAIVLAVGIAIFGVPFRGNAAIFTLGALLFLFVTLGVGVLVSSVSQNQAQAMQLAMMAVVLPQVLLSGLIFPLNSIVVGVRWISYLLPLTYFNEIARGVMLRAEPIGPLWPSFVFLGLLGVVVVTGATLRFRAYLAPAGRQHRIRSASEPQQVPA